MRTFTESAGGHLSGYVNMSGITGKENSGWIPDRKSPLAGMISHSVAAFGTPRLLIHCLCLPQIALIEVALFETV